MNDFVDNREFLPISLTYRSWNMELIGKIKLLYEGDRIVEMIATIKLFNVIWRQEKYFCFKFT
jgi:hypothetical protein